MGFLDRVFKRGVWMPSDVFINWVMRDIVLWREPPWPIEVVKVPGSTEASENSGIMASTSINISDYNYVANRNAAENLARLYQAFERAPDPSDFRAVVNDL